LCVWGNGGQLSAITRRGPVLPTSIANNRDRFVFFIPTALYVFEYGPEFKKKKVTQKVAWTKETLETI
jgi:hypothetical protein